MQRADCKQLPACAGHSWRKQQWPALPRACSPDEHAGVARLRLDACDEHGAATQLEAHHGARDCAALWCLDSLPATTEQAQGRTAPSEQVQSLKQQQKPPRRHPLSPWFIELGWHIGRTLHLHPASCVHLEKVEHVKVLLQELLHGESGCRMGGGAVKKEVVGKKEEQSVCRRLLQQGERRH